MSQLSLRVYSWPETVVGAALELLSISYALPQMELAVYRSLVVKICWELLCDTFKSFTTATKWTKEWNLNVNNLPGQTEEDYMTQLKAPEQLLMHPEVRSLWKNASLFFSQDCNESYTWDQFTVETTRQFNNQLFNKKLNLRSTYWFSSKAFSHVLW